MCILVALAMGTSFAHALDDPRAAGWAAVSAQWSRRQLDALARDNLWPSPSSPSSSPSSPAVTGSPLTRVDLPVGYLDSACLDGSNFFYYLRRSADPAGENGTKWIFWLQGGGLCVEPIDCASRQRSSQGSSNAT